MSVRHPTLTLSYRERAQLPNTPPLASYLLQLIALKKTNLCLSADVTTTSELLTLADEVGDSICILKTHCDIIKDFGERTVHGLRSLARRKKFLIFEDRKFADIGETVKKQYTAGPFRIARWAEITNAHILPGPAIITGLKEGASAAITAHNASVHTEITTSPPEEREHPFEESDDDETATYDSTLADRINSQANDDGRLDSPGLPISRKHSVVSVTTSISTRTESISPLRTPDAAYGSIDIDPLAALGDAPPQPS